MAYKECTHRVVYLTHVGLAVILTVRVAGVILRGKEMCACTMHSCFPAIVKVTLLLFVNSVVSITTSCVCFSVGVQLKETDALSNLECFVIVLLGCVCLTEGSNRAYAKQSISLSEWLLYSSDFQPF